MEDTTLEPCSIGNKIRTGVKIQLPEGWLALIIPRSSIGAKTPLRLSNSVGLIDSGYRGELGILYDNIGDDEYVIHAGDRIAQLLVMPSYRFQAKVVDILADSDRGEGGFGSSGN
jgi:dUTP pyrophosphatase